MAFYESGDLHIHYELEGAGFPVLLIAPGGMRSANDLWAGMPWNPRIALVDQHQVIGMDQRNAGRSTGPVSADDGWHTYTADQLALLDHLGVEQCHVLGMCIGGPYIAALLKAAPERFRSAVILQPVGIEDNRGALEDMFDAWATEVAGAHPAMDDAGWRAFRGNMWGGEFLLTASEADVAQMETPMLVLMGDDMYHPQSTSQAMAAAAPNCTLVEQWKDDESLPAANDTIRSFLASHTP